MHRVDEIFDALLKQVLAAENFRIEFDKVWKKEVGRRGKLSTAYLIRHSALPAAFENLLFLFCSHDVWAYGGFGARASEQGFSGPIHLLSHGDAINKMKIICLENDEQAKTILSLLSLPNEVNFLVNEIENIKRVVAFAFKNFDHNL